MKAFKLLMMIALIAALVLPVSVWAKDTDKAGKITAVSGKAEVKKSGGSKKFNAFKGMAITKGDTIITGKDGKVTMDLDSDKEVTIGTDTTLVISELVESAKALGGKTSLSLLKGKVVVNIKKKLDGDSRFEIETPTAIMGVMGTQFTVGYEGGQSYVAVFEGAVSASPGSGGSGPIVVSPEEQLLLDRLGKGESAPLNLHDLPLIGLEYYLNKLEQEGSSNAALLDQLKQLIDERQQQERAAANADSQPGAQGTSTIVYETPSPTPAPSSSSEGPMPTSAPTSTPEPSPTPAPTPTPIPTPEPTPTTAPPVLDAGELAQNKYNYLLNDRTVVLPFTEELALHQPDALAADIVEVRLYDQAACEWTPWWGSCEEYDEEGEYRSLDIEAVEIDSVNSNRLIITLAESLEYGARIQPVVQADMLKNVVTGEVQAEAQLSQGLLSFVAGVEAAAALSSNPTDIHYRKGLSEDIVFTLHTLGYEQDMEEQARFYRIDISEGVIETDVEGAYSIEAIGNAYRVSFHSDELNNLPSGWYLFRMPVTAYRYDGVELYPFPAGPYVRIYINDTEDGALPPFPINPYPL